MEGDNISLIVTLVLVFAAAIGGGVLAKKLRQPAILGYVGAGIVVGNLFPGLLAQPLLALIADSGVTLLLFTLGVEFSFIRLHKILKTVAWAAILQILFCTFIFLLLSLILRLSFLPSLFLAAAASLSSTALVVKLLGERGELDTVPGEVATGWLVIQDLAVIPLMLLLPALVNMAGKSDVTLLATLGTTGLSLIKSVAILTLVIFLGRFAVPRFLDQIAKIGSREIFVLTTVGLVFLAAVMAYIFGLSAALGAFIAGLLVAETSQNHAIFAEIRPLRDLFVVVFFVSLGMSLSIGVLFSQLPLLASLAFTVVLAKILLVYFLCRFLGYHRKTAFLVALYLSQMSEFGFIFARAGLSLGSLNQTQYSLLVALVLATILLNVPLVTQAHRLYYVLSRVLGRWWPKIFPVDGSLTAQREEMAISDHIVICGYGRVGKYVGRALQMANIPFLVVDYNHYTVASLKEKGIPVVYGDPADKDVLDYAQVDLARMIIIAIPDRHTQEMIIANTQSLNRRIRIICRTHHEEDQRRLKSLGVHVLVQPEFEAALSIIERLLADFGATAEEISGKISRIKIEHGLG